VRRAVAPSARLAAGVVLGVLIAQPSHHLAAQLGSGGIAEFSGSARSAALGGAGAALVGDASAVFANPAALATIRHAALEACYERRPDGGWSSSGAAAVRVARFDYGVGAQELVTPGRRPADVLGLSALTFRMGLIALGASLKYVRENVAGVDRDAWAGDAGMAIALFDIVALGASVQNFGGDLGGGVRLPRRTRVGFTMNYVDPQGAVRLLTTVEGQWQSGASPVLVAGAEGGIVLPGRIGILGRVGVTGHSVPTTESAVAVGAGLELGRLRLDYGYQASTVPGGGTHRVAARWTP
jgi:hypothetical protein